MADLDFGRTEAVLPGVSMRNFDIAPDGKRVTFETQDAKETGHAWVASLDRRTPPKQLVSSSAHKPRFGPRGDIYFVAREGTQELVYSVDLTRPCRER